MGDQFQIKKSGFETVTLVDSFVVTVTDRASHLWTLPSVQGYEVARQKAVEFMYARKAEGYKELRAKIDKWSKLDCA